MTMNSIPLADAARYAASFGLAFLLTLYLTPLTIRVARTFQIQDVPDGRLKKHEAPTPYLGGLAVAAAFIIAFSTVSRPQHLDQRALGLLFGGSMMLLLGLYDDLTALSPHVKFLGQLLAASVLYKTGVKTEVAQLGVVGNFVLTMLWITGVTNAFNIIDVMDGLATGAALIASVFLFLIAALGGDDVVVPFMVVTLAGALTGFLRFNRTPARIFLGDTGSLFIGFLVAALSMLVSYSHTNPIAATVPLVLLAIPLFDTAFVAWHRARQGIPFFRGSPDHFALRLAHAGRGVRGTIRIVYRVAFVLGLVSLVLVFATHDALVGSLLALVVIGGAIAAVRLSRLRAPPR